MPNVMNVTLDKSSSPWRVDVDDSGNQNEVGQSPNAQTIQWQLSGNAATGSFVAMTATEPGFQWMGDASEQPPSGIFSTPVPSNNGNSLSMTDLNNSSATQGQWIYMLRVNVGGVVYTSEYETIEGTKTNPVIVND